MVFFFIALHPHSRGFSGKARRNELPPWCFHPCSMIFELISIVYFMHKAFDCSPQEALMLLNYLSLSTQFSFFFDLTVCILAFKCSFFCQCIPVACLEINILATVTEKNCLPSLRSSHRSGPLTKQGSNFHRFGVTEFL